MKKFILAIGLCAFFGLNIQAAPALRRPLTVSQSDGTTLVVYNGGDEHFHYYTTRDGVMVAKDAAGNFCYTYFNEEGGLVVSDQLAHEALQRTAEEVALVKAYNANTSSESFTQKVQQVKQRVGTQASAQVSAIGSPNIPILLIQYSDVKFSMSDPKTFYDKHCNAVNYKEEGGAGSVRDYFIAQSNGKFSPHYDIIGPLTLDKPMAYYGANTSENQVSDIRVPQMIKDAIEKARASGTDFSKYDEDKDGKVKIVCSIYAGFGENTYDDPDCVWPQQGNMSYSADGVTVTAYACINEMVDYVSHTPTVDGIGVFCHEFSHCLGLPDFYNVNSANDIFGLSYWSLMDYGLYWNNSHTPIGYTAYEREFMGWMDIETLASTPQNISLPPLADSFKAYRIVNEHNTSGDEYYILENRQASTWFPATMGTGMLVFHVDYNASAWTWNNLNNDKSHQRMTIIPADGSLVKENDPNVTSNDFRGDPYPGYKGNTALTDDTTPAAVVYAGNYMGKPITNIAVDDKGVVTFKYMGGVPVSAIYDIASGSNVKTGYQSSQAFSVKALIDSGKAFQVYNLNGVKLRSSSLENLPEGLYIIGDEEGMHKVMIK